MIAQSHAQIERRLAAEEVVDLVVVERLERLHDGVLGPLGEQARLDGRQQDDA